MRVASHQQLAPVLSVSHTGEEPASPVTTHAHRAALEHLARAFTRREPLVFLIGEGKAGASYIIRRFLAGNTGNAAVVRIAEPCPDAIAAMRKIIRAVGFETENLTLTDLQNVFTMFLSYQKSHQRRTVICIEEAQDHWRWVSDEVSRLVGLETEGKLGLMLIVSGRPGLNELLDALALDAPVIRAAPRLFLAPFSLAETREYIQWQIESAGTANIAQVFEFDAITLIHELCAGVPDKVTALYRKCIRLSKKEGVTPATTGLVDRANQLLQLPCESQQPEEKPASAKVNGYRARTGKLIIRMNGELVVERPLDGSNILIGRDKLCGIRLASLAVSRHHALLVNVSDAVTILDIGSTNGTFVDGRRIRQHVLQDSCEIVIGDHRIEYRAGVEEDRIFDIARKDGIHPHNGHDSTLMLGTLTCGNGKGSDDREVAPREFLIKGNVNRKGEKIYHAPGTPLYDLTRIDESKGERWFRSEEEATAAGWRAPKN